LVITEILPEVKLEFIPDEVKEGIFQLIQDNVMEGSFSHEDSKMPFKKGEDTIWISFNATWRIIELNHNLMWRIILWQSNHYTNEGLTEELFIKFFGKPDGCHFYKKWMFTYKRNLMDMFGYFGMEYDKGQKFCDMLMQQVLKYELRKAKKVIIPNKKDKIEYSLVHFKLKEYKTREIFIPNEGQRTIASYGLQKVLLVDGEPISEKAEEIDNTIFYYIPDNMMGRQDDDIIKFITKNI